MNDMKYDFLRSEYDKRKGTFELVKKKLHKDFLELKKTSAKDTKLRIAYIDARIKDLHSIIAKAYFKKIKAKEIFEKIDDIVGVRLVVNNICDIEILLEQIKKNKNIEIIKIDKHKDEKGY